MSPKPTHLKPAKAPSKSRRQGFFLRGIAVLLPTVLTLVVFVTVWQFLERYVTGPINAVIYGSLEGNGAGWTCLESMEINPYDREYLDEDNLPPELRDKLEALGGYGSLTFNIALVAWRTQQETFFRDFEVLAVDEEKLRSAVITRVHPAIGTVLTLILVLTFGYLASGFIGRSMLGAIERLLMRIPLVRSVYPTTKQLVEFFFSDKQLEFDHVVALPYPSDDIWSIGFVTGNGLRSLNESLDKTLVTVFVPTSPVPMTGFMVFLEQSKLRPLDLTVEEALRITITGGVIVPPKEQITDMELAARLAA